MIVATNENNSLMSRRTIADEDDFESAAGPQFDPMQVVLHHKWLILATGLIGIALGYLYYTRQAPVYESFASLLVVPEKSNNLPIEMIESTRSVDDSMSTQMILIRSSLVIDKAVKNPDLAKIPSITSSGNAAAAILGGLSVTQARASNGNLADEILELRYRGGNAEDCGRVLQVVIAAYQEFLGETRQSISSETVELITNAKDSLLGELSKKEQEYREFRKQAPPNWQGEASSTIRGDRLAQIESARTGILITTSKLKAQIAALEQALKHGTRRDVLELLAKQISASSETAFNPELSVSGLNSSLKEQLNTLKIEEKILSERFGARHPRLIDLQRRLRFMTELIEEEEQPNEIQLAGGEAPKPDIVQLYLESLQQELAVNSQENTELNAAFEKELEVSRGLEEYESENMTRLADIARTTELFDGIVKRLQEISLVKDAGGTYTQIIAQPGHGFKVLPRLTTTVASGMLLGVALGFAFAAAIELSNRDFRSVDELSKQLQISVLGQFADGRAKQKISNASIVHSTVVTHHEPQSLLAEAYRSLRTCLYFSTKDLKKSPRVIQITSPMPGDGKSTLVANLGVVMAQSGKRVVVVEADLRKPRLANIFGISNNTPGIVSLLSGVADPEDSIMATEVANLWLLPVGKRPENPSELLGSPAFQELLEILREQFDLVLIDSPPLLPVTDASVIATMVEGVVCLFKVRKNLSAAARASMKRLQSVGAPVLGAVIHGQFQRQSDKHGYYGYYYNGYGDSEYKDSLPQESSELLVNAR
ncbi:polysaccharide biosynthesis tyrosine autokinase [bacterium]|nr:polysaccharide biosynthesis tyrosine autokinase [bacterium]